jgi:hypothetical protein
VPSLLHIVGSAHGAIEVALISCGLGLNFLGLGVAVMALWPRRPAGAKPRRPTMEARRRALRAEGARLLDENIDGGA